MCRKRLPDGATHCPTCGLRIAALDRAPRHKDLVDAGVLAGEQGPPLSIRAALLLGAAGGVLLLGLSAVIALAVARGHEFGTDMSNAAFFTGGVTMTLAVVLGGVRVSRLLGDVELMKKKARGQGRQAAHDHIRLGLATAAALPLAVAIGLAAAAH